MVTENRQQGNKNLQKKISNNDYNQHTKSALSYRKGFEKPPIGGVINLREDIDALISAFSHHTRKKYRVVLNYLISIANKNREIYPCQQTIARECDISVDQVIRILKELENDGLITITHRKDKTLSKNRFWVISNLYTLNQLFYDIGWRNAISSILPALKYLPLSILLITSSIIAKNITLNLQNGFSSKDVNQKEVILDFNIFVKKQNAYRVCAREEFAPCQKNRQKLEAHIRESMKMNDTAVLYDNAVFSETVRKAGKELKMSCAGMCSISSFNDMVINVALKRLETYSKRVDNPFGLFISICNQASKDMRMPVKHTKAYALASQFDIKLGKDAAILEGGNTPREPQRKNIQQREGKNLSTDANRHLAPTNKVYVLSLEALRSKNPSIPMVGVKQISQGIVEIQHHNDIEWRATTQEERDIWLHTMQQVRSKMPPAYVQFMPKLEAPLQSKGDPNITATKLYHIDTDNVLHDIYTKKLGCKLCDKNMKIC